MADIMRYIGGMPGFSTQAGGVQFNESTRKWGWIFQAESAITCDRIVFSCFKFGTSPTFRASIQGVTASTGNPDGTIACSGTFTVSSTTVAEKIVTMGAGTALTEGNIYAAVLDYSSGTINASNYMQLPGGGAAGNVAGYQATSYGLPYGNSYASAAWTKATGSINCGYGTSSAMYGNYVPPATADSMSSNNTYAIAFTMPSGSCATYQIAGLEIYGSLTSGNTLDLELYNAGSGVSVTTTQKVTSIDTDYFHATLGWKQFLFSGTLPDLTPGTVYRVGLRSTGAGTIHNCTYSASYVKQASWGRDVVYNSTRSSGNWTDTTLAQYAMRVLFKDITGSGAAGGIISPRTFSGF